jgi:DNA repair exonuclease SbcCD ATPase subunit
VIIDIELTEFKIHEYSKYKFLPGINAIVGPGGCGKTSIMEAIGWTVFGTLPGKKVDFVPLTFPEVMITNSSIELSAMIDYKLVEICKHIAGFASLYLNDRMVAEGEMAVRETVADLVGYKRLDILFSGLIGITQGSLDGIFSRSTSERVKVFSKILNIDKYKLFSDWLLESHRSLNMDVATLKGRLDQLVSEKGKSNEIKSKRLDFQTELDDLHFKIEDETRANNRLKESLKRISEYELEIKTFKDEIDRLTRESGDIDVIERDIRLARDLVCPSCGGLLGVRKKEKLLSALRVREALFYKNDKRIAELAGMIDVDNVALSSLVGDGLTWVRHSESDVRLRVLLNKQSELRGKLEVLTSTASGADDEIKYTQAELSSKEGGLAKIDVIRAAARKLPALIAVDTTQTVSELATEFVKLIYLDWSIVWNEDFSIAVNVGEMELSFSQLSKSQKSIAALSVVLALAKLVSPVDFILLDEPFANMDAAVAGAIRSTGWFEQVILTTHRAEVEHVFDNVIEVAP